MFPNHPRGDKTAELQRLRRQRERHNRLLVQQVQQTQRRKSIGRNIPSSSSSLSHREKVQLLKQFENKIKRTQRRQKRTMINEVKYQKAKEKRDDMLLLSKMGGLTTEQIEKKVLKTVIPDGQQCQYIKSRSSRDDFKLVDFMCPRADPHDTISFKNGLFVCQIHKNNVISKRKANKVLKRREMILKNPQQFKVEYYDKFFERKQEKDMLGLLNSIQNVTVQEQLPIQQGIRRSTRVEQIQSRTLQQNLAALDDTLGVGVSIVLNFPYPGSDERVWYRGSILSKEGEHYMVTFTSFLIGKQGDVWQHYPIGDEQDIGPFGYTTLEIYNALKLFDDNGIREVNNFGGWFKEEVLKKEEEEALLLLEKF